MEKLSEIYFVIGITIFSLFVIVVILLIIQIYEKRKNSFLKEKLQMQARYQQELLLSEIEIKEQTLQNISQEIHDNIGQSLSLAKLNLNTFDIAKPEQALNKVESSRELVSKAITDLRNLSKSLNTDSILNAGFKGAVEHELAILERTESFSTSLVIEGSPFRFDPKKELILFRIFQEALNNIIKHAHATAINLHLLFGEKMISLSIADNGKGFQFDENFEGSGIRNMKSRAVLIGADFDLQSGTGGTRIQITLPISIT